MPWGDLRKFINSHYFQSAFEVCVVPKFDASDLLLHISTKANFFSFFLAFVSALCMKQNIPSVVCQPRRYTRFCALRRPNDVDIYAIFNQFPTSGAISLRILCKMPSALPLHARPNEPRFVVSFLHVSFFSANQCALYNVDLPTGVFFKM